MQFIKLESISKVYTRGTVEVPVLKGVSLAIDRGEMVALMGASGSGKTTLINLIGCLDRPTSGRYWLEGREVSLQSESERARLRSRKIGFVFQNFNLLPRMSALENVMTPLVYGSHALSQHECRARARQLLDRMGLADRVDHEPSRLSGGEQQRVAIARALINNCSLLIADEPTGNLDSKTGEEILALFRELNEVDGLTIIMVTHDAGVAGHADRVIRMRDGLVQGGERTTTDASESAAPPAVPVEAKSALWRSTVGEVRFLFRTIATSFRSLRRNALRSALTTLGIIIGVGSLLSIAEIGKGAWTAIRALLTKTGVDCIVIQAGAASRNGVSLGSGSIKTLTPEDAEIILHECPSVDSLAPLVFTRRQVVHGNKNWGPQAFVGTTPDYLRVREWTDLDDGESFTERDVRDVSMVCLIGQTVARELFGEESPIGQEVHVSDVPLRVIGVLSRKGADIVGEDQDDLVVAPWTTVKFRISSSIRPRIRPQDRGEARSDGRTRHPCPPLSAWPGRSIPVALAHPGDGHPSARAAVQRRLDPGAGPIDRRDPSRHGPDQAASCASATSSGRASPTTSRFETLPRWFTPSREPWDSSPDSLSAWH